VNERRIEEESDMMRDGWDHSGWPLGLLMMVVFWGLVFWLVMSLVRRSATNAADGTQQSTVLPRRSALDVLDERLARGEIDTDDYEQRRRALTNT